MTWDMQFTRRGRVEPQSDLIGKRLDIGFFNPANPGAARIADIIEHGKRGHRARPFVRTAAMDARSEGKPRTDDLDAIGAGLVDDMRGVMDQMAIIGTGRLRSEVDYRSEDA